LKGAPLKWGFTRPWPAISKKISKVINELCWRWKGIFLEIGAIAVFVCYPISMNQWGASRVRSSTFAEFATRRPSNVTTDIENVSPQTSNRTKCVWRITFVICILRKDRKVLKGIEQERRLAYIARSTEKLWSLIHFRPVNGIYNWQLMSGNRPPSWERSKGLATVGQQVLLWKKSENLEYLSSHNLHMDWRAFIVS
jgi:hypothetical protein